MAPTDVATIRLMFKSPSATWTLTCFNRRTYPWFQFLSDVLRQIIIRQNRRLLVQQPFKCGSSNLKQLSSSGNPLMWHSHQFHDYNDRRSRCVLITQQFDLYHFLKLISSVVFNRKLAAAMCGAHHPDHKEGFGLVNTHVCAHHSFSGLNEPKK